MSKPDRICEACGAKASAHVDLVPPYGLEGIAAVRWLLKHFGACIPGCQGCAIKKAA
jgi:hypothetical protein